MRVRRAEAEEGAELAVAVAVAVARRAEALVGVLVLDEEEGRVFAPAAARGVLMELERAPVVPRPELCCEAGGEARRWEESLVAGTGAGPRVEVGVVEND